MRDFAGHRLGRRVEAQALEHGVADMPVRRPFGKRDFGDELRLDPALGAGDAPRPAPGLERLGIEQRFVDLDPDQAGVQVLAELRVPAGADVAGVLELARIVIAEQQAADLAARSGPVGEAADHELLARLAFQLQPGLGARRHIGRIGPLEDDAFEVHLPRRFEHACRRGVEALAEAHPVRRFGFDDPAQHRAARQQGKLAQIAAVEERQVEHEVIDSAAARRVDRVLQGVEVRHAGVAHDDDLAVEPGRGDAERLDRRGQRTELGRPVVTAAGDEPGLAVLDPRHQSVAVELGLDDPLSRRRRGHQRRELRRELGGQGRFHALGKIGLAWSGRCGGRRTSRSQSRLALLDKTERLGDDAVRQRRDHVVLGQR